MYKAEMYNCYNSMHRFYWREDKKEKNRSTYMAVCVNLTNVGKRVHKSLPIDNNWDYVHISPYEEEYYKRYYDWENGTEKSFWGPFHMDDRVAYVCEVMR